MPRTVLASVVVSLFLLPGCFCNNPDSVMVYEDDDLPWGGSAEFEHDGHRGSLYMDRWNDEVTVFIHESNVDNEALHEFTRAYWAQYDMEPVFRNATYSQRCSDGI